jgi:hypothetical protein
VRFFFAEKTLEWDLAKTGNWEILLDALKPVKPRVSDALRKTHQDSAPQVRADALLEKVARTKGDFAMELAMLIPTSPAFDAPPHIQHAIEWVVGHEASAVDLTTGESTSAGQVLVPPAPRPTEPA